MTSTKPRSSFLIESLLFQRQKNDQSFDTMELKFKKVQNLTKPDTLINSCCEAIETQSPQNTKPNKREQPQLPINSIAEQQFQRILANLAECRQEPSYSAAVLRYQNSAVQNTLQALTLSTYFKKYDILQQAVSLRWNSRCSLTAPLHQNFPATTPSYSLAKHFKDHHKRIRGTHGSAEKSNIKKYRCDVCDKTFSRSNTLITHKRIHTGEKPFECDHCGRAFRQPGNLTRHRLTHTTVKPYICSFCDKAFNRASNLHTHIRTHANVSQRNI